MSRTPSPLEALSEDLIVDIFLALAHPLYPHPAFALSNSCRSVRAAVARFLNHVTANGTSVYRVHLSWATAASSLAQRRFGTCAQLRVAKDVMQRDTRMAECDLDVLGYLLSSWLPTVIILFLARVRIEGEGATLLFRRLAAGGGAVNLVHIYIDDCFVEAAGVQALGIALRRGSMPAIETIYLGGSLIGVGLVGSRGVATLAAVAALAAALSRALPPPVPPSRRRHHRDVRGVRRGRLPRPDVPRPRAQLDRQRRDARDCNRHRTRRLPRAPSRATPPGTQPRQ